MLTSSILLSHIIISLKWFYSSFLSLSIPVNTDRSTILLSLQSRGGAPLETLPLHFIFTEIDTKAKKEKQQTGIGQDVKRKISHLTRWQLSKQAFTRIHEANKFQKDLLVVFFQLIIKKCPFFLHLSDSCFLLPTLSYLCFLEKGLISQCMHVECFFVYCHCCVFQFSFFRNFSK